MALNVSEATAVNTLLDWIGVDRWEARLVTDEEAKEAAALLAEKASDRLMAGVRRDDVEKGWPES
jgi:hypothetical protein